MRKLLLTLITIFCVISFAVAETPSNTSETPSSNIKSDKEIQDEEETPFLELDINFLGLFFGNYTARVAVPFTKNGLGALGLSASYYNQSLFSIESTGYSFMLDARFYPYHQMTSFYFGAETGYTSAKLSYDGDSTDYTSIPFMGLLGYKFIINEFSIDFGFACGKQFYISQSSEELNGFPFNLAYDGFFRIGYRF